MEYPDNGKRSGKAGFGEIVRDVCIRLLKSVSFWGTVYALAALIFLGYERVERTAESVSSNGVSEEGTGADILADSSRIHEGGGGDTAVQQTEPDSNEQRKRVALTFDDGPHPVYTARLLDGLKERGICAAFFVVGKNIKGNEELIRRMDEEGHLVGNHTYDHVKISTMSDADACEQVTKTSALVKEIIGKDTEFIRPPFGSWNRNLECSFEMIPVLWDVDPLDWTTKNTSLVVQRVLDETDPGDVILLHDVYSSSVDAALMIADELLAQGYEFVTVDKLILE